MSPNSERYMFGHAKLAGMLADGDEKLSSYEGYVRECDRQGIISYKEELYNEFMKDCKRDIKLDVAHVQPMEVGITDSETGVI